MPMMFLSRIGSALPSSRVKLVLYERTGVFVVKEIPAEVVPQVTDNGMLRESVVLLVLPWRTRAACTCFTALGRGLCDLSPGQCVATAVPCLGRLRCNTCLQTRFEI